VKYAETLREGADKVDETYQRYEKKYLQFATADLFKQESIENLRKSPLFQIWRDHLLSISLLKKQFIRRRIFCFSFSKRQ